MKLSMLMNYAGGFKESVGQIVELEKAGLDLVWIPEAYSFDAISQVGYLAARTERLDERQVATILADTDVAHFHYDEDSLGWGDWRADREAIQDGRRRGVLSFGSCSFDEPVDDLRQLGWLPLGSRL